MKKRLTLYSVKAMMLTLTVGVALSVPTSLDKSAPQATSKRLPASAQKSPEKWTELAKKVGTSEDVRGSAIQDLKAIKGLKERLKKAIYTADRPLALDVISALDMKELIPDLLLHVPADPDGFLTVAVNAMMTDKNQTEILNSYQEILEPGNIKRVSSGAIVAMLEPLGRLAIRLPKPMLQGLKEHESPEVRASLLYYLRIMALRNQVGDHLEIVNDLLKSNEFQLRLQAVSMTAEILDHKSTNSNLTSNLMSRSDLKSICKQEKAKQIREACLGFVAAGEGK